MNPNKEYYIKVYRPGISGAFVGAISSFDFSSFRKQINSGLGEFSFVIPKPFDNFGELDLVAFNNQVKLYCADIDSGPDGVLIYSGWIYSWEESVKEGAETVKVNCYGNVSKLSRSLLKIGASVILGTNPSGLQSSGNASATNVETVFKQIIDRYQAEAVNPLVNYTASSVSATGQTMTYQFDKKMTSEALELCRQAAPAGWYWYVDQNNAITFAPKPSSTTHTFILGKHFTEINVFKNSDKVVNNVLFHSNSGGQVILKRYSDSASQNAYDDRWEVKTDNRVSDTGTADNIGNQYLSSNKDAKTRTQVVILDNNLDKATGYNIEIINPGETCNFRGFNDITQRTFFDNMLIVSVEYRVDCVLLELEELDDSIARQTYATDQKATAALGSNGLAGYDTVNVSPLVGQVIMHAASSAPAGFLLCNGQAVSRTTYSNLFAVIGTTFGAGDGSTTFNVPNFQDRFAMGASAANPRGSAGGASSVNLSHGHTTGDCTLNINQIPAHSHGVNDPGHSHGVGVAIGWQTGGGAGWGYLPANNGWAGWAAWSNGSGTGIWLSNNGGNGAHNHGSTGSVLSSSQSVQNPFLAINFIIRY